MKNESIKNTNKNNRKFESGFSLIELLVVMGIIVIMTTVSLIYFTTSNKLYKPDVQAMQISDLIQEARQRALTQRETMRVELDLDSKVARLIDENGSTVAASHTLRRTIPLFDPSEVRIDTRPNNVTSTPSELAPTPAAVFRPSTYIFSPAHAVCTLRFKLDGTVVDAGTDGLGLNANPVSITLYVWKPKAGSTTDSDITRALTVVGSSGAVRIWEYAQQNGNYVWQNSRRGY